MFVRLLIFLVIGILVYRAIKSVAGSTGDNAKVRDNGNMPLQADDTMRQDPQCGVYVSRRDGIAFTHNGREFYFCSEACRDKYLESCEK